MNSAFFGGYWAWERRKYGDGKSPPQIWGSTGPYLLQLLQLALSLCPLQLQVSQLTPHGLYLLGQLSALFPRLRQRLLCGLQPFLEVGG